MSCLLKQWLVIKCTEVALYNNYTNVLACMFMKYDYLIILVNNMQIVTYFFCIPTI